MSKYSNLFSPFILGTKTLKNRIVGLPHGSAKVHNGIPTNEDIDYWESRARGGAGLLIIGGTIIHPSSGLRRRMLMEAFSENALPKLKKRTDAIHAHGTKVFGQLVHLGREMIGGESDYPLRAPSSIQSPRALYRPYELEENDIKDIINDFAVSARNLKNSGHDGVEIHAAHGYLVAQFLSPATNKRTDKYGGSLKGRMRFLMEVLNAVRQVIGDDLVLGIRLSADEEVEGGLKLSDTLDIVKRLSESQAIDYFNITLGIRGAYVKDMSTSQGTAVEEAREIRKSTNLPVLVSQRIKDPDMAEKIVAEGSADLVGMARALIADSDWPIKVKEERIEDITPCIGCNQDCRSFDPHLLCAVNPVTGREGEWGTKIPTSDLSKNVAVVGGGPAGLEAARVAAIRGHSVHVFEQNSYFGGQVKIAANDPNRREIMQVIHYLESQVRKLGVTIHLGQRAEETILKNYDTIILATGAVPITQKIKGYPEEKTLSIFDALQSDKHLLKKGDSVVVIDDGRGFWPAFSAAEVLSSRGAMVTYVTSSNTIGGSIPQESLHPLLRRLGLAGVRFMNLQKIIDGDSKNVRVYHVFNGEEKTLKADLLVIDAGKQQEDTLSKKLKRSGDYQVESIGDVLSPRRISNAMVEAHRLARTL
ncbi:FAD-dependent oxidoreductase [Alteribacillus sp. YIM 98480]|uniref:oxidoreductase n=1 Tax=Alteribacillus sp. YIM 98480 TaxID=2606599 RepID=UPI002103E103|nr:FAD-dependent oxidoreductase [Alteribacillus sp. YIM 98480]